MAPPGRGNTALSDIELEEALAKKSLERGMFMRLLPLLYPVRGWVIGAVLIEALLVGAIFLRPWLVSEVIDEGFIPSDSGIDVNYQVILWTGIAFTLTWIARFILAGLGQYVAGRAAINVINSLRVRVFTHVQRLSIGYFDRTKAGHITTRAMAILLVVGGRGVALEQITLGQVAASLFYVFIFLAPLQELSDLFERYANGAACAVTSVWCCRIMCCSAVPSSTTCALLRRMPAMNS